MAKATTIYLDPKILHAVKIKAVEAHKSVSKLVNEALQLVLREDISDLGAIRSRKAESARPFEDVLKGLKKDGLL